MREGMLKSILESLNRSIDVDASAVISTDGLSIASLLSAAMDEDRVGAVAAAMLSLGDRIAVELARGKLEQAMIKGTGGYVLLIHAGHHAVLAVIARPEARLGLVFLDSTRAALEIADIL